MLAALQVVRGGRCMAECREREDKTAVALVAGPEQVAKRR